MISEVRNSIENMTIMVLIIKREVNIRRTMIQISLIKGYINKIMEISTINRNKKKKITKNNKLKPLKMK